MTCYLVIAKKAYPLSFASAMRALAFLKAKTLEDAERVMIESTIVRLGRQDHAADALGISTQVLYDRRKKYDLMGDMRTQSLRDNRPA